MPATRYSYQSEKLNQARSCLMLPLPGAEVGRVVAAFELCHRAFNAFDVARIDDEDARAWVEAIKGFMDTSGLVDPSNRGLWFIKAEQLSQDDKSELCRGVDALANYFDREFWRP